MSHLLLRINIGCRAGSWVAKRFPDQSARIPEPERQMPALDEQKEETEFEYLQWVMRSDLDDVLTLRRDTAERVLTKERMRLLEEIQTGEADSVRDLARRLDRNKSVVHEDLQVLREAQVIEYEQNGRAKRPVLAHENVLVRPIVFKGAVMGEDQPAEH